MISLVDLTHQQNLNIMEKIYGKTRSSLPVLHLRPNTCNAGIIGELKLKEMDVYSPLSYQNNDLVNYARRYAHARPVSVCAYAGTIIIPNATQQVEAVLGKSDDSAFTVACALIRRQPNS